MKEQGIEEILKSALNNFEADVDPQVWTNVQQAINTPATAPANHGANGSVAGKAGVVAGKLGVKAIIAIVTVVTGVSVGTYFLLKDTHTEKVVPSTVQSPSQTAPAANNITQQQTLAADMRASGSSTIASAPNVSSNISPERKEKAKSKVIVTSPVNRPVQLGISSVASAVPSANVAHTNPMLPKQIAPVKTQPAANAVPAVVANADDAKPATDADAAVNHVYQNDFADISDYLEPDAISGKMALPNIFSPNGDGKNDVFTIKTKNLKALSVTVFDLSGKLIYQWSTLDGGWDGNLSDGRPAPIGNYYYSLLAETADGKRCIANSILTLRR